MTIARLLLLAALASQTGCVALLDAAFKETNDHGRNARYENKSFGEHYLDSLLEDDDDDCETYCDPCGRTTVIVHHH